MKLAGIVIICVAVAAGIAWRAGLIPGIDHDVNAAMAVIGLASTGATADAGGTAAAAGNQTAGRRRGGGAIRVATEAATAEDMAIRRRTIGVVSSPANLTVTSETQGLVTEVVARDGALVKTGDVLVRLDDRIAEATVAKDRAALERDRASLEHAQAVLERQRKLASTNAVAQQAVDDAAVAVETAEATVALDEAVLKSDQVTLTQKVITAPFGGRLGAFNVVAGSLVQSSTAIVRLTRLDPLQASFSLPERDVAAVMTASGAGRPITVAVTPLGSARSFTGRLDFADVNVDSASGTFEARATLADSGGELIPGQSLSVEVTLGSQAVVAVPSVAIQTTQSGTVVYVVGVDGKIAVRPITVALTDGDRAGIAAGLAAGERVVVEGQASLAAGTSVVDASATAPQAQGGGRKMTVSEAAPAEARP